MTIKKLLLDWWWINWLVRHSPEGERLVKKTRKLERLANIDPLTGAERRHRAPEYHEDNKDNCETMTFVMMDIDHFKQVNDNFGHPEGDKVLKEVANVLIDAVRDGDLVSRYGGEEFLIILKDVENKDLAHLFVDRIRKLVNKLCILPNGDHVGISAGVFIHDTDELFKMDLLTEQADLNLYEAKKSGRNCVISSASSETTKAA